MDASSDFYGEGRSWNAAQRRDHEVEFARRLAQAQNFDVTTSTSSPLPFDVNMRWT